MADERIEEEIQARLLMATLTEVEPEEWLKENHPDDREGAEWMWLLAQTVKYWRSSGYSDDDLAGIIESFKLLHNALVERELERIVKGKSCHN